MASEVASQASRCPWKDSLFILMRPAGIPHLPQGNPYFLLFFIAQRCESFMVVEAFLNNWKILEVNNTWMLVNL
jgi:hypothetical protein